MADVGYADINEPILLPTNADVARAHEVLVAPHRADGTPSPLVPVWVVGVGDAVFVRTDPGYGSVSRWYRRALASGNGRIRLGDQERQVSFTPVEPTDVVNDLIDDAYLAKYRENSMMSEGARAHTLRIDPPAL